MSSLERERERSCIFFKQMQLQSFLLTSSTFTLFPRMGTIQQAAGACDDLPRPTLGTRTRHPDSRRRDRRERRRPRLRTGVVVNSWRPHNIAHFPLQFWFHLQVLRHDLLQQEQYRELRQRDERERSGIEGSST